MTQSNEYHEEQIEMVRQQATIVTDRSGKQKKVSGGVGGAVRQDTPCNPLIGWKTGNSSLPPGWKIKRHEYANQTVYFYMSPKGDIIKSRRAVMDYMFQDGDYSERDFNIVISGAKQRKEALQKLFDAKDRRRRKKRSKSEEEYEEDEEDEETDDPKLDSDEELDPVEDDDKFEDAKKCHKKNKPDKFPVLPTRRSGRIRIKEERQKEEEQDSGAEDSESESESIGGSTTQTNNSKRRLPEESSPEAPATEPKRKRGRPPKSAIAQSFEHIELKGESEEEMIADTLLKVEQNMGDSLVKLDGALFKVELSSQDDIKDFDLSSATEIKVEESLQHNNSTKKEDVYKFTDQNNPPNSIQKPGDKVFYVGGGDFSVSGRFASGESLYTSSSAVGQPATTNSAYAVVVNVLKDIVSSISD